MGPANTPKQPVAVEYNARGERKSKTFTDHHAAKSFYLAKVRCGAEPKIRKA